MKTKNQKQLSVRKMKKMLKVKNVKRAVPKDNSICYCQETELSVPHFGHR